MHLMHSFKYIMDKHINKHFVQKNTSVEYHVKRCLTSLAITEKQIKIRCHYIRKS